MSPRSRTASVTHSVTRSVSNSVSRPKLCALRILFFVSLVLGLENAHAFVCPPATPEGDRELSAQVVRYVLSGFGSGIPAQGLPCLNEKNFPQFQIPKAGTEEGDIKKPTLQWIAPQDQVRITEVKPLGKNQIRVSYEILPHPGKKRLTGEITFLRHLHPRAQSQLGCVSFLERPWVRYRPKTDFCPNLPALPAVPAIAPSPSTTSPSTTPPSTTPSSAKK